jgi:hypothetical protein
MMRFSVLDPNEKNYNVDGGNPRVRKEIFCWKEEREVRYMLYGIHWEIVPEKVFGIMKLYEEGKVVIPKSVKIVEEYMWGNKSLEIVETDDFPSVLKYCIQFTPYVRNFEITALMTAKEILPKPRSSKHSAKVKRR